MGRLRLRHRLKGEDMTQDELLDALEERTEYILTLQRDEESGLDEENVKGAFAFVLGGPENNLLIVEGRTSGDGKEAVVTVWACGPDGMLEPSVAMMPGSPVMITQRLD
jgi:hypothetical protein